MKKICFLRFFKALALLLPIIAMVLFTQRTLFAFEDYDTMRLRGFYQEPPDSLDVVVMGSSEVYHGYAPGYIYELTGLTSYPYTSSNNPCSLYLSQLKEILSRQNPQLILVEVNGFLFDSGGLRDEAALRRYVENIPLSQNKIQTILNHPYEDSLSCLIPFFKYHGNWKASLEELMDTFQKRTQPPAPSALKGHVTYSSVSDSVPKFEPTDEDGSSDLDPAAYNVLIEFLEFCQSLELDNVVFMRFPHKFVSDYVYNLYLRSNRVEEIVREYGFDYVDLEVEATYMGIDPLYDFMDREHLNYSGQIKLGDYLCELFLNEYGLEPMEQTPENQRQWEEAAAFLYPLYEAVEERMENGIAERLYETPALMEELHERMAL